MADEDVAEEGAAEMGGLSAGVLAVDVDGVGGEGDHEPGEVFEGDLDEVEVDEVGGFEVGGGEDDAVDTGGGSDEGGVGAGQVADGGEVAEGPESGVHEWAGHTAEEVEEDVTATADAAFDEFAEDPETEHIDGEVPEADVEELAGEEAPDLALAEGGLDGEEAVGFEGAHEALGGQLEGVLMGGGPLDFDEPVDEEDGGVDEDEPGGDGGGAEAKDSAARRGSVIVTVVYAHDCLAFGRGDCSPRRHGDTEEDFIFFFVSPCLRGEWIGVGVGETVAHCLWSVNWQFWFVKVLCRSYVCAIRGSISLPMSLSIIPRGSRRGIWCGLGGRFRGCR